MVRPNVSFLTKRHLQHGTDATWRHHSLSFNPDDRSKHIYSAHLPRFKHLISLQLTSLRFITEVHRLGSLDSPSTKTFKPQLPCPLHHTH